MKQLIILAAFGIALVSCKKEGTDTSSESTTTEEMTVDFRQTALAAQDALFKDFDAEAAKTFFSPNYIQHNPGVPTGLEPVLGFLPALKEAGTSVTTHRVLVDGDYVVLHNQYDNAEAFGAKELVGFDVWRMEDGKVAEHWDNLTPLVAETASGRSQVDGPTAITDLEKTEANKTLVSNMMDDVFFGKAPEKITEYISTEQYDQHNPAVKDGLAGLNEALTALAEANNPFIYKKVHKVIGEGNFVLTMSEGEWNQEATAFYDLFRIENGKIVEHWDAIAAIPAEMAHDNGKF
ncbi:MAG: nuclear transport factor 2 family protein [Saprospiraceae bacterium]|nr:nuclear transport factor 2 family protein [Saprospiraceae bacterium]